jgi:hypothetical protein
VCLSCLEDVRFSSESVEGVLTHHGSGITEENALVAELKKRCG